VALIVDAGAFYAQANAADPHHGAVARILLAERETLVTSELVVAEADYLILDRLGVDVELAFVEDLAAGTFVVECLGRDDMDAARQLIVRHRDLRLGLADASLVVLARRYATTRILTLDERAFRAVAPLQGGSFTILPADLAA
jgi:predicted nucleic acid-binding protein